MDRQRLDEILAPGYLGDLEAADIRDIRSMRAECQEFEAALSYVRRVTQGRLDIVAAEVGRRAAGEDPLDLHDLVGRLPEILSDRVRTPGVGRLPQLMAPGDLDAVLVELDAIAPESTLTNLASLPAEAIADLTGALSDYERAVSSERKALHECIDALQAELTRRYKTGEATVESLLT